MEMASFATERVLNQALALVSDLLMDNAGNLKEDFQFLAGNLEKVLALLLDAERKSAESGAVQDWLQNAEAVAIGADDLIEEYAYEILRQKVEALEETGNEVSPRLFHSLVDEFASKIKDINLCLERIYEESVQIGLISSKNASEEPAMGLIDAPINKSEIVGRESDMTRLLDMLINSESHEEFSIVSIVGNGGQGKTAVARLVYEDPIVVKHFDSRIWVCLSEDFDVVRIFHEMVESISGYNPPKRKSKESIMRHLGVLLRCRRYLIVCDDVCSADRSVCESLKKDFLEISCSRGSKMMITTRSQQVAEMMNASLCYHLGALLDDDGWNLFKRLVFEGGRKETPELVVIGKRMVKRCRGVPLVIKLIAGLVCLKRYECDEWSRISDTLGSSSDADVVLAAIRLNFNNLPSWSLRQCFLYCSVFPKHCAMEREALIQLWMAQGLLNPLSKEHPLDVVGDNYFNVLLQTSLLQEPVYDDDCNIVSCKMDSLVHDFALCISKRYCSLMTVSDVNDNMEVADFPVNSEGTIRCLRALYFIGGTPGHTLLETLSRLHVLILDGKDIKELPSSIGEVKSLRLLDLARTAIDRLPDSITKLYSLQILRVGTIRVLPKKFTNLKNLRNIYGELHIPGIGELTCIETMPYFDVRREQGYCIGELGTLDNLKGRLVIYGLQNVTSREEAMKSNLHRKLNIAYVELQWPFLGYGLKDKCNSEEVLDGLRPHSNIVGLTIANFEGYKFPSWMTTCDSLQLNNLVQIQLENCEWCEHVPTLGLLPNLQLVKFRLVDNVKCIGAEFYGLRDLDSRSTIGSTAVFPALRKLKLNMKNLVEWLGVKESPVSSPKKVFPKLQKLKLHYCSSLTGLPQMDCLDSLQHLAVSYCHQLASLPDWVQSLVSLQDLILSDNPLTCLPEMNNLISLQRMSILNCDSLICLPDLSCVTALQKLEIRSCGGLVSVPSLPCGLQSLRVDYCYKLDTLPELSSVTALEKLEITSCPSLVSIGIVPCSLESLHIDSCRRLNALPCGLGQCKSLRELRITGSSSLEQLNGLHHLSSLRRLEIGNFSNQLDHFPWEIDSHFNSLEHLELVGWSSLRALPELQHLPDLRELIIKDFSMVEALPEWLGDLQSLQFLWISSCWELMYLPSAEAMRRLTKLQSFDVWECRRLKERCEGNGPEWHKISHVSSVSFCDGFE